MGAGSTESVHLHSLNITTVVKLICFEPPAILSGGMMIYTKANPFHPVVYASGKRFGIGNGSMKHYRFVESID